MTRRQVEIDLQVDETSPAGTRIEAAVHLEWSGVLEEAEVPRVEEALRALVAKVVRSFDAPQVVEAKPMTFIRALHEASDAELGALGVRGEIVDVRMAELRVHELVAALPPIPAEAPPVAPVAAQRPPSASVDATTFGGAPLTDDALPFQDTGAQVSAPAPSASSLSDHEATGATIGVGELRAEDIFPEETPEMSLEQYASLCVERALNPGQEGEVAARYRILTEVALRQLDEQWRGRFAQEGELHQRFQQAYAQYQAWLRQQRGDG